MTDEQKRPARQRWIALCWGAVLLLGLSVVIFSKFIVFPGLELLLGIDTIVGEENVRRYPGGYMFTNPGAMISWVAGVAAIGFLTGLFASVRLWRSLRRGVRRPGQTGPRDIR